MNTQHVNKMAVVGPNGNMVMAASVQPGTGAAPAPAPSFTTAPLSAAEFSQHCGEVHKPQMMQIPVYTHIVEKRPVTYVTTRKEVSMMEVPIQHNYVQRTFAQDTVAQCPVQAPCAPAPCAPVRRGCC